MMLTRAQEGSGDLPNPITPLETAKAAVFAEDGNELIEARFITEGAGVVQRVSDALDNDVLSMVVPGRSSLPWRTLALLPPWERVNVRRRGTSRTGGQGVARAIPATRHLDLAP